MVLSKHQKGRSVIHHPSKANAKQLKRILVLVIIPILSAESRAICTVHVMQRSQNKKENAHRDRAENKQGK